MEGSWRLGMWVRVDGGRVLRTGVRRPPALYRGAQQRGKIGDASRLASLPARLCQVGWIAGVPADFRMRGDSLPMRFLIG